MMRSARKSARAPIYLILLILVVARVAADSHTGVESSPASVGASLWDRAVDLYTRNADLVPGRMHATVVQYNGRGHVVSEMESEYAISVDENGELVTEVVYSRENGEPSDPDADTTSGGTSNDEESGATIDGFELSPFDPAQQDVVSVGREGMTERINGILAVAVPYRHQISEETTIVGTAWLSVSDGVPVRLTYTLDPLPRLADQVVVAQEYFFGDGQWGVAAVEFEATGHFLFVRRRLESRMEFSEYFRAPK